MLSKTRCCCYKRITNKEPTWAHNVYRTGEYMIWTDYKAYGCKMDTNFSPVDYPGALEIV